MTKSKALRQTQRCETGVGDAFWRPRACDRFEYNMSLYDTYLLLLLFIHLVDDMTRLPFYIFHSIPFHSDISVRGAKLDLGSPVKDCGYDLGVK